MTRSVSQALCRNEQRDIDTLRDRPRLGQKNHSRFVTHLNKSGLGNRLRLQMLAHAYALHTDRTLVICWKRNDHLGAQYDDLFEYPFPTKAAFTEHRILRRGLLGRDQTVEDLPDYEENLVVFERSFSPTATHGSWQGCGPYKQQVIQALQPRAEIRKTVDRWKQRFEPLTIGMHLRMGDFKEIGWAVGVDRYVQMAQSICDLLGRHVLFYLSSDGSVSELQPLIQRFHCLWRDRRHDRRDQRDGAADALVDLLLLSQTRLIMGTHYSSFSDVAAFIGGIQKIHVKQARDSQSEVPMHDLVCVVKGGRSQ